MAIEVISQLKQKNGLTFPIVDSNDVKGGFHNVATLDILLNTPSEILSEGMLAFTRDTNKFYQVIGGKWVESDVANSSSNSIGIPIITRDIVDYAPNKYVMIPDETQLNGETKTNQIKTINGTYIDILLQSLRKLQAEVARLRNSFTYGIYSYTDTNTALSTITEGYKEDLEDEPLWAIEESDLSEIDESGTLLDNNHHFSPADVVDISKQGILTLTDTATWNVTNLYSENLDTKQFIYLTTNSLNIQIQLQATDTPVTTLDLAKLNVPLVNKYQILVIISREINNGKKFIWISIDNQETDKNLIEGYWTNDAIYSTIQTLPNSYNISQITFGSQTISKFKIYSRYQNFTKSVIPSKPSDEDYKYKVAHITIRSVKDRATLISIQSQLPNNELIWEEADKKLWIKTNNKIVTIGGTSINPGTEEGMTQEEMIAKLQELGIVQNNDALEIGDISSLTFIHQDTNKKFKFNVDAYGELKSKEIVSNSIESRLSNTSLSRNVRGLIGQLNIKENNQDPLNIQIKNTSNAGLNSDRLKIGAIYCPLPTDKVFGCSHAFIELENTSQKDINLEGCYLHYARLATEGYKVNHLALNGIIPAGGTYLIRGKQYSEFTDVNTFIKVENYDQEWYDNGKLIDLTVEVGGMEFALTYGEPNLDYSKYLYTKTTDSDVTTLGVSISKATYTYETYFIDSLGVYKGITDSTGVGYWCPTAYVPTSNSIIKNTFELDPAQQGYQALNTYDSSRQRWSKETDTWILSLNDKYITFPHTDDKYPISKFAPKASFEHKNVCTDKSKLDLEKPNMVTCSFGINTYTTRCFNWISAGVFDEYVWIKSGDTYQKFKSYDTISQATDMVSTYPRRKEWPVEVNNAIYARIVNRFPADNTQYSAHKCIIEMTANSLSSPTTYTYIVGRALKDGTPDLEHCSEEYTFTLYPETYTPRIYQVTDQQGFHWVEYQVWAASAKQVDSDIKSSSNIIPVLINTGDMTQNGTRINEWFDYYQAGKPLFKHLEQMYVVGNNDLCGTNVTELGTGDDYGKSNSYYFHVFYCYEVDPTLFTPIINQKYIPSLYYFDFKDHRFIMVNSEITSENCLNWFNLSDNGFPINIYTGYTIPITNDQASTYHSDFMSIYTMVYKMLTTTKYKIVACHEMPFTVITNDSLTTAQQNVFRSVSSSNALVGSHLNQITPYDKKGLHWFSRLLEFKGVKICLGGHKHTYACTYPVREYFTFGSGLNSKDNYAQYTMEETLEHDNVSWVLDNRNLSKFPLVKRADVGQATTGYFYPYTPVENLTNGVAYFMCQSTGYKLTSNKELPSANQKYSQIIPQTSVVSGADKPDKNQQYPMYAIIDLDENTYSIKLIRLHNVFDSNFKFSQSNYSSMPISKQYLAQSTNDYGTWQVSEATLITI